MIVSSLARARRRLCARPPAAEAPRPAIPDVSPRKPKLHAARRCVTELGSHRRASRMTLFKPVSAASFSENEIRIISHLFMLTMRSVMKSPPIRAAALQKPSMILHILSARRRAREDGEPPMHAKYAADASHGTRAQRHLDDVPLLALFDT